MKKEKEKREVKCMAFHLIIAKAELRPENPPTKHGGKSVGLIMANLKADLVT